jgi:hypothetical protein
MKAKESFSCYLAADERCARTIAFFNVFKFMKGLFRPITNKLTLNFRSSTIRMSLSIVVLIAVFTPTIAKSHHQNGIYLTEADFKRNVVSYPSRDVEDWLKVDHNENVVISRNDSVIRFKHHQVYGFLADGHKHFRWGSRRKLFSNAGYYKVIDTAGLIILYTKVKHHKFSSHVYKYCKAIGQKRKVLTVGNLSRDFAHQPSFVNAIKSVERTSKLYDLSGGITVVNQAYLEYVKPTGKQGDGKIARYNSPRKKGLPTSAGPQVAGTALYYQWYGNK